MNRDPSPVVVAGMHRSGTSLVASTIAAFDPDEILPFNFIDAAGTGDPRSVYGTR